MPFKDKHKNREYKKEWFQKKKTTDEYEQRLLLNREWKKRNREKLNEYQAYWRSENREKEREQNNRNNKNWRFRNRLRHSANLHRAQSKYHYGEYWEAHRALIELVKYLKGD